MSPLERSEISSWLLATVKLSCTMWLWHGDNFVDKKPVREGLSSCLNPALPFFVSALAQPVLAWVELELLPSSPHLAAQSSDGHSY